MLEQVTGYSKYQTPLFVRYSPCSWGEALSKGSVCPKGKCLPGEVFSFGLCEHGANALKPMMLLG